MSKEKCQNCGRIDSIHIDDEETSQLIFAFGPKDAEGLQIYYIYCRSCNHINILKPNWRGKPKHYSIVNMHEAYQSIVDSELNSKDMNFIPQKLLSLLIQDGVFPANWTSLDRTPSVADAKVSEFTEIDLMDHYSKVFSHMDNLERFLTPMTLAELYLFRGWTTQFGFRMFSSHPEVSEDIISEVVNLTLHLGVQSLKSEGIDIENLLGSDYLSILDNRWGQYDDVIVNQTNTGIPTAEIVGAFQKIAETFDPMVFAYLSIDFLAQLNDIKLRAMEINLLRNS